MSVDQRWFLQPISVPLQREPLEPASLQAGAEAVVAKGPRSFEVFWDGSEFDLHFGAPTSWDLDLTLRLYRQHVKVGLPSAPATATAFSKDPVVYPGPPWLTKVDPSRTRFFFVGNERGHCFSVFDTRKTGQLMTPLLITLQRSRFAWVQFEWFEADLKGVLGDLRHAMARKHKEINSEYISTYSQLFDANPVKTAHPAKGGDFDVFYPKLKDHIEAKESSSMVVMIIRGVVDPGKEGIKQPPFGMIEDVGEVRRGRWLGPSPGQSLGGDSKLGDRLTAWWTGDPRMLLDMVQRRAFDVHGPMASFVEDYLPRRRSLPFVILGREEVGLLIHPPSSDLRGLKTTRGSELPPPSPTRMEGKQGITITGT